MSSRSAFLVVFPLLLAACEADSPGDNPSPASGAAAAGRSVAVAARAETAVPPAVAAMDDDVPAPARDADGQTEAATPGTPEPAELSEPAETAGSGTADDDAPLRAAPPPGPDLPAPDENGVRTINWDDLLPEGELERIQQLYESAYATMEMNHFGGQMPQIGTFGVEEALIGETVRMPGFILPLDYQPGGEIDEFLLVPYFGACIHTPPPPPNQIVYVTLDEPLRVDRLWDPIWATGELTSDRHMNELGDAAYTMRLTDHEPYE